MSVLYQFESVLQILQLKFHSLHKLQISLSSLVQYLNRLAHVVDLERKWLNQNCYMAMSSNKPYQLSHDLWFWFLSCSCHPSNGVVPGFLPSTWFIASISNHSCFWSFPHTWTGFLFPDSPCCWLFVMVLLNRVLLQVQFSGLSSRASYLFQQVFELFGSSVSGTGRCLGSNHGTDAAPHGVVSWAVHLPALLRGGRTHLRDKSPDHNNNKGWSRPYFKVLIRNIQSLWTTLLLLGLSGRNENQSLNNIFLAATPDNSFLPLERVRPIYLITIVLLRNSNRFLCSRWFLFLTFTVGTQAD